MIIRNDASSHYFLALRDGRPKTDDRSTRHLNFNHAF